jgi:ribosomal protein S18 acetylase RimI-like enzyme
MDLTFRRALPSDYAGVDRVLRAAFTPYIRNLGREIGPDYNSRLDASIERGEVYVAVDADQVAGAAVTERQDGRLYLDRLAVDPARQGTGVGSWLLVRLEEVARAEGVPAMSLFTAEMAAANVRLYQRHGFEIVERGPPTHGKDSHVRVYMVKRLEAP